MKSPKKSAPRKKTGRNNVQTNTGKNNAAHPNRQRRLLSLRKLSREAGGAGNKHSWRDFWKPHPAAEVFHRRTTPEQLRDLAKDIDEANGLKVAIQTRNVPGENGYVIDGISRLDAMEKILG